ncbi:SufD family Fe-S cluster assembly protein, partial [Frigoribacterium sp. ACAM 257]|uniref:SufD family Fe-S cluster assembly protein n=1 Tax=Frigoribacterium sp. ACAM 257 TaxID=2508998 RepID=UPI00351B7BAB
MGRTGRGGAAGEGRPPSAGQTAAGGRSDGEATTRRGTSQGFVAFAAHLAGQGSDTELYGVYFADAGQHLEQQVYVHHDAPNSRSRV